MQDFDLLVAPVQQSETGFKRKLEAREYLKAFETAPVTLLNPQGEGFWNRADDATVWNNMILPLKTGAKWATEYASISPEHRGVAANRWFKVQHAFCKFQQHPNTVIQNQSILDASFNEALYLEIDNIIESFDYITDYKKPSKKTAPRCPLAYTLAPKQISKETHLLEEHSKKVWEWIALEDSKIRMLMLSQSAGGLPYVTGVYFRTTKCFKHNGNIHHTPNASIVTLTEFQDCIKHRHNVGSDDIIRTTDISDFIVGEHQ